jgi:hypothetical protein
MTRTNLKRYNIDGDALVLAVYSFNIGVRYRISLSFLILAIFSLLAVNSKKASGYLSVQYAS